MLQAVEIETRGRLLRGITFEKYDVSNLSSYYLCIYLKKIDLCPFMYYDAQSVWSSASSQIF
jgi:hypothetical protein